MGGMGEDADGADGRCRWNDADGGHVDGVTCWRGRGRDADRADGGMLVGRMGRGRWGQMQMGQVQKGPARPSAEEQGKEEQLHGSSPHHLLENCPVPPVLSRWFLCHSTPGVRYT